MECIINGTKVKYEGGQIYKFCKYRLDSKEETWIMLKGSARPDGRIRILINHKSYYKYRVLYKIANPEWDIENSSNSIDHININCKDNSLENLRPATQLQQILNRKCMTSAKGYIWCKANQKWKARIVIDGKTKYLGLFDLESDAHQAYLNAVAKYRPYLL